MAWPPPGDPLSLRDAALDRTRRLSWGIAAGALAATATLGFAFSRALPGHAAQAGAASGRPDSGTAPRPAGGSPSTRPHRARAHTSQQAGPASAPPAPAPAPPPPQVTSGGS
jgi:hypothetical protein